MKSKKNITIFNTADALFKAAAQFIIDAANNAVQSKGQFTIVLSGGHTPEQLFSLLSEKKYSEQMPWKNTIVFWGDERCVPLNDERNNANMAISLLLSKVDIPASNLHRIQSELAPKQAAMEYENEIKNFFNNKPPQFDLILLGLGEDGHTASLFPGTEVLNEKKQLVKEVYNEEQKMFRITMTAPLINMAHAIIFLVTGKQKAKIFKAVSDDTEDKIIYPAQMIQPSNGELYWFVDNDATSES